MVWFPFAGVFPEKKIFDFWVETTTTFSLVLMYFPRWFRQGKDFSLKRGSLCWVGEIILSPLLFGGVQRSFLLTRTNLDLVFQFSLAVCCFSHGSWPKHTKSAAPKVGRLKLYQNLLQIKMEPPKWGGLQMCFLFQRRQFQVPAVHFAGVVP